MVTNRTDPRRSAPLDVEVFGAFGDTDSIIDRLLDMPAPPVGQGGSALWEAGVVRRLEKVLADRIRERIEARAAPDKGDRLSRA